MELSELTDQLRSNKIKIEVQPSYKTYYNVFPHVIRFSNNNQKHEVSRPLQNKIREFLKKLDSTHYKVRRDYYDLNVYCMNPVEVLGVIPPTHLHKLKTTVEVMDDTVISHATAKVVLPRAVVKVAKKLPYNEYRYKVYWSRSWKWNNKQTFLSIIDHINNDPDCKPFTTAQKDDLKNFRYWGGQFFYTKSENILCIISLINHGFIQRIEKFITLEEINEQESSRNPDQ